MDFLAQMGFGRGLLAFAIIFICLLLMLVILLQKGRGGGLAGAFGGGGGSSAFGAKTGDVFTWITVGVAVVFISLAIVGNFVFDESAVATAEQPVDEEPVVPLDFPAPTDGEPQTITIPIGDDVDASGIAVDFVRPDGTVVPIPIEIITEPAEGAAGQGEPSGGPAGDGTVGTPAEPPADDPPSGSEGETAEPEEQGTQPGGEDSSAP